MRFNSNLSCHFTFKKAVFFILILAGFQPAVKAQPKIYEFRYGVGFAIPHRAIMKGLIKEYVHMSEIILLNQGDTKWEHTQRYMKWGVNCIFTTLGNQKVLGPAMGIFPYMEYNNIQGKRHSLHFGLGVGGAFVPQSFSIPDNHTNIALSSKINGAVNFRLISKYKINDYIHWNAGIGFTHISNGSYKLPNLGVNTFTIINGFTIGHLKRNLPSRKSIRDSLNLVNPKKWKPFFFLNTGLKEVYPVLGKKYVILTGSMGYYKWMLPRAMVGGQIDLFHDTAIRHHFRADDNPANDNKTILQVGASIFLEYKMNRFSFPIQLGTYLYDEFKSNGAVYTKLGTRYALTKNLIVSFVLKSHYAKADYFEGGMGWRW